MRFKAFIEREIKLAQANKPLDALATRFVQLHQQAEHDKSDAAEYSALHRAMRSRWRWQTATLGAQARRASGRDQTITGAARPASTTAIAAHPPVW